MKSISHIIYKTLFHLVLLALFFTCLNRSYKFDQLNKKKYLLLNSPTIYFAGDSRAWWQLKPDTASKYLGIDKSKIANIARMAGHPLEVENLMRGNVSKFKDAVVIISVSAFLVNGNAKSPNHHSMDLIANKNIFEQLRLFSPMNMLTLQKYYSHIFGSIFYESKEKSDVETNGFRPLNHNIDSKLLTVEKLSNDPWYSNYQIDKEKVSVVEKSLKAVKGMSKTLIVYNGPYAVSFLKGLKETEPYCIENSFDKLMKLMCAKNGITYISYFNNINIGDEYFADWAHLNEKGAELFTVKLLSDISTTAFQWQ